MAYTLKKIVTDDPFTDYIIYHSKYMAINCITKNETLALAAETKESYINYQQYFYAAKNELKWELWDSFTYEELSKALNGKYTEGRLKTFANDKSKIPEEDHDTIIKYLYSVLMSSYEEKNDYYRTLMGLRPSTSTVDIILQDYGYTSLTETVTHLHTCSLETLIDIVNNGILDKIINAYPDEKWIQYIKARVDSEDSLDPIQVREAENFELLYVPSENDAQMKEEFIERYTLNREYVLNNIYSEAFKYGSDYYDNFIQVLIIILTIIDMLDTIQDHIVRKDILEIRCIQYIFEQYGIPYYDEIPLRYQIAMMKNINELLKFKSTARCMIDLCSLFGFPSSEIFQLYLLRLRKVDENENFIFNYKTVQTPINIGEVHRTVSTFNLNLDEYIELDYPVDNYFDNGNIIEVWLDDIYLSDEYYTIYDNKLYFEDSSIVKNHAVVKVIFYYDENTISMDEVGDYRILKHNESTIFTNTQSTYKLNPPINDFFNKGGLVKVILGMLLVPENAYELNENNQTITFKDKFLETADESKYMEFIYYYSNTVDIHHKTVGVTVTEKKQNSFKIPEPFPNYYDSGSRFFVSVGGTYIASNRYHVINDTLVFNSEADHIEAGQTLFFHFIYTDIGEVELITNTVEVTATKPNQTEFDIPVPYEAYFTEGNPVYIKVKGFYMSDKFYTITKNKLNINPNYAIYIGGIIEFTFIYGKLRSTKHSTQIVTATDDFQQDFYFKLPYQDFLKRGNKLKVVFEGIIYVEDVDYTIKDDTHIEIFTIEKSLHKGEQLYFEFFYNEENENIIVMKETEAKIISNDQSRFNIPVPFYKYFETGNEVIVTLGSTYVSPNDYTITDNTLIFNDDHLLELAKDRLLNFTFIYHSIYYKYNSAIHKDIYTYDIIENFNKQSDSIKLQIPFPFENYLELGNTFELRVGEDIVLNSANYDILNNEFVLIHNANETVYPYGKTLAFVFIYSCIGYEYITTEMMEEDCELKFVKIPILETPDKYIKEKSNYIDYDTVTLGDKTWDGDYLHNQVKQAMLYKDFNYTRTKYFSITNMISMCNIAYQVPYFMNMILDRIRTEEDLTLTIPFINNSKKFKFNDIITFMMCLSHKYMGVDDEVPTIAKALYIKGFNFEADLAQISSYITQKLGDVHGEGIYHISTKYKDFKFVKGQVPSYKELINIYTTNTEVYDHVVHEMLNADNKLIFDIYKKIYESLMTIKESKNYFKIGTKQASTITEWIKARDITLYEAIQKIDSTTDETDRKKLITDYLEACNYELEAYIDADVFRYFLGQFAGNDSDALIRYLKLVINFFKSYKIQIYDVNTEYVFDDKLENTLRAIDFVLYTAQYTFKDEGQDIFDLIIYMVSKIAKDSAIYEAIREKLMTVAKRYVLMSKNDKVDIRDFFKKYLTELIIKDEVIIKDLIKTFTEIVMSDEFDSIIIDILKVISHIKPKDYAELRDKYILLVKQYKQSEVKDYDSTMDVFRSLISEYVVIEDINQSIIDDIIAKTYLIISETSNSGIDWIRHIKIMLKVYDLMKVKDKIEIFKKIYQLVYQRDKYKMVDLTSLLKTSIDIDEESYYKTIDDLIPKINNQYTISETNAGIAYITQKLTSQITFNDLDSLLDRIEVSLKHIEELTKDDYTIIVSKINSLISQVNENDLINIKDELRRYTLDYIHDYDTSDIMDKVFRFIISYTRIDKIMLLDDLDLIAKVIRKTTEIDKVDIVSKLLTTSQITSTDVFPYTDDISKKMTLLYSNDLYTQVDNISKFMLLIGRDDIISFISKIELNASFFKPILAKSLYDIVDRFNRIQSTYLYEEGYRTADAITSYYSKYKKDDFYRLFTRLKRLNLSFRRNDWISPLDSLLYNPYTSILYTYMDKYLYGESEIKDLFINFTRNDIYPLPIDSITKLIYSMKRYDSYRWYDTIQNILASLKEIDKLSVGELIHLKQYLLKLFTQTDRFDSIDYLSLYSLLNLVEDKSLINDELFYNVDSLSIDFYSVTSMIKRLDLLFRKNDIFSIGEAIHFKERFTHLINLINKLYRPIDSMFDTFVQSKKSDLIPEVIDYVTKLILSYQKSDYTSFYDHIKDLSSSIIGLDLFSINDRISIEHKLNEFLSYIESYTNDESYKLDIDLHYKTKMSELIDKINEFISLLKKQDNVSVVTHLNNLKLTVAKLDKLDLKDSTKLVKRLTNLLSYIEAYTNDDSLTDMNIEMYKEDSYAIKLDIIKELLYRMKRDDYISLIDDYHTKLDEWINLLESYNTNEYINIDLFINEFLSYIESYTNDDNITNTQVSMSYETRMKPITDSIKKIMLNIKRLDLYDQLEDLSLSSSSSYTDKFICSDLSVITYSLIQFFKFNDNSIPVDDYITDFKTSSIYKELYERYDRLIQTLVMISKEDDYFIKTSITGIRNKLTELDKFTLDDHMDIVIHKLIEFLSYIESYTNDDYITSTQVSMSYKTKIKTIIDVLNKLVLSIERRDYIDLKDTIEKAKTSLVSLDSLDLNDRISIEHKLNEFLSYIEAYTNDDSLTNTQVSMSHKTIMQKAKDRLLKYTTTTINYDYNITTNDHLSASKVSLSFLDRLSYNEKISLSLLLLKALYIKDTNVNDDSFTSLSVIKSKDEYLDIKDFLQEVLSSLEFSSAYNITDSHNNLDIWSNYKEAYKLNDEFVSKPLARYLTVIHELLANDDKLKAINISLAYKTKLKPIIDVLSKLVLSIERRDYIDLKDNIEDMKNALVSLDSLDLNDRITIEHKLTEFLSYIEAYTNDDSLTNTQAYTHMADLITKIEDSIKTLSIKLTKHDYISLIDDYHTKLNEWINLLESYNTNEYINIDSFINEILSYIESYTNDDSLTNTQATTSYTDTTTSISDHINRLILSLTKHDYISTISDYLISKLTTSMTDTYDIKYQLVYSYPTYKYSINNNDTYTIHDELNVETIE